MGDPTGIGHDGSGHCEALGDSPRARRLQFDLRQLDAFVVHRHDRGLDRGAGRFGLALRDGRRCDGSHHALQRRGADGDHGARRERYDGHGAEGHAVPY
jgi:hypothetical protein